MVQIWRCCTQVFMIVCVIRCYKLYLCTLQTSSAWDTWQKYEKKQWNSSLILMVYMCFFWKQTNNKIKQMKCWLLGIIYEIMFGTSPGQNNVSNNHCQVRHHVVPATIDAVAWEGPSVILGAHAERTERNRNETGRDFTANGVITHNDSKWNKYSLRQKKTHQQKSNHQKQF